MNPGVVQNRKRGAATARFQKNEPHIGKRKATAVINQFCILNKE